ncbi:MAG: porin [Gammaproteobacteria bacterium]|nr:porin [Gammaproteobacteria bacterium]
MNKKLLTMAIGSALTVGGTALAPAYAETVNINVYGVADGQYESVKAEGSTASGTPNKPSRWRGTTNSSYLGFKGSADLGSGLKGLLQFENTIQLEADSSDRKNIFGSARDTYVGIAMDGVGTLKLGRVTAAGRWISGIADYSPGATGIESSQSVIAQVGGFTGASPQFNTRLENALAFESASWGGFGVRAYFGANENKSNSDVNPALDDKTLSLGLQYASGPIDVRLAREVRYDKGTLNGTTQSATAGNDTKDTDTRAGVSYTFPSRTTIGVIFDRMEFDDSTATGTSKSNLKKSAWQLGAKQDIGETHQIYGAYGTAGKIKCSNADGSACNDVDSKASQYVVGYNYVFSKQTMLKTFYSRVTNNERAKYDFDGNAISPAVGADPTGFGFGIRYTF